MRVRAMNSNVACRDLRWLVHFCLGLSPKTILEEVLNFIVDIRVHLCSLHRLIYDSNRSSFCASNSLPLGKRVVAAGLLVASALGD